MKEKIDIEKLRISPEGSLNDAMKILDQTGQKCLLVTNDTGTLLGTLTDGDIRRKILNIQKPFSALLGDDLVMHINKKPKKIFLDNNINQALDIMKNNLIWDLPVVNKNNILQGMLHLHPVVKFFINK